VATATTRHLTMLVGYAVATALGFVAGRAARDRSSVELTVESVPTFEVLPLGNNASHGYVPNLTLVSTDRKE